MAALDAPLTNGTAHANGITPDGPAEPVITFDPSIFRAYLRTLLPPLLGAQIDDVESVFDHEFDERVSRFTGEGGGVMYIAKKKDEVEGECRRMRDAFKPV